MSATVTRAELLATGVWIRSSWCGTCANCGHYYLEGAVIRLAITAGSWVAECCFETGDSA